MRRLLPSAICRRKSAVSFLNHLFWLLCPPEWLSQLLWTWWLYSISVWHQSTTVVCLVVNAAAIRASLHSLRSVICMWFLVDSHRGMWLNSYTVSLVIARLGTIKKSSQWKQYWSISLFCLCLLIRLNENTGYSCGYGSLWVSWIGNNSTANFSKIATHQYFFVINWPSTHLMAFAGNVLMTDTLLLGHVCQRPAK